MVMVLSGNDKNGLCQSRNLISFERKQNVYVGEESVVRQYVPNRYLWWKLRNFLHIINGVDTEGTVALKILKNSFSHKLYFFLFFCNRERKKFLFESSDLRQSSYFFEDFESKKIKQEIWVYQQTCLILQKRIYMIPTQNCAW